MCCGLAITGGYHRLFAHRTYRSHSLLELFYLCFGAGAAQNSALKWSSDHRIHHTHCDREMDPYNIRRGFFWAHMGWVFFKDPDEKPDNVRDLEKDALVRFQDRFYLPLAVFFGGVVPAAIASLWGDSLGGFLVAGVLRLVLQYQSTFSINSLAHTIGTRPYSKKTSARDSFVTAIFSFGEGYHNFHHRFPGDYRNGIRAWHFDPTKWWLWGLSKAGFVKDLKRVPREIIEAARRGFDTKTV